MIAFDSHAAFAQIPTSGIMAKIPSLEGAAVPPHKRVTGLKGYRQHMQVVAAAALEGDQGPSQLGKYLLSAWAWGEISAPCLQQIAACAAADGATKADVIKLGSLGCGGAFPGNVHRDLLANLAPIPLAAASSKISLNMRTGTMFFADVQQSIILPHVFFSNLFHNYKEAFLLHLCGGSYDNLPKFWDCMETSGHPAYVRHPLKNNPHHRLHSIPISVHGDAVPVSQIGRASSRSAEIYSWCSMLGKGTTLQFNFLIFFLFKSLVRTTGPKKTMPRIWKIICWSLDWLQKGTWPTSDVDGHVFPPHTKEGELAGSKLADGYCCVLWGIKGDLEFLSQTLDLNHASSHHPCVLCRCNTTDLPWADCRPTAAWLHNCWDGDEWLNAHGVRHELFKLPGVTILNYMPDLLHTKHLGSDAAIYGSVLHYLVNFKMGGVAVDNLAIVWGQIKDSYTDWHALLHFPSPHPPHMKTCDTSGS